MIGRVWTIAKREFGSYFDHATAYILLVIFLVINFYFYFQDVFLVGEASLRPMLGLLPWLLLFFVPAVCMRTLAEERNQGTLELVLAQPIEVHEFLLGKFLGVLLFMLVAMGGTLGIPIVLSWGADLQVGVMLAQYIGSIFLIAALIAVGIWSSSMTRNQVTAFILGVTVGFGLYLLGLPAVVLSLPPWLAGVATRLGILGHFDNIQRGVIDLRDVLYFLSVCAAFLSLTYFSLMRERLSRDREAYGRLRIGTIGLVGIAIFAALAGSQLRGRLDLTPGQVYTLSEPAEDLLRGLDDIVTLRLFRSNEIPPQLTPVSRDVDDLLRDFDSAGGANVNLVRVDPAEDPDAAQEAAQLGIEAVEFQTFDEDALSIRSGYFGLAVQYAGESMAIPIISRTTDLEYRLASMIRSMTSPERPNVAILQGHGELDLRAGMQFASMRLREEYDVTELMFDSATVAVPDSIDVVVIAGGTTPFQPAEAEILGRYVDGGGSVFILKAGVQVDVQSRFAGPAFDPALDSLLQAKGLGVVPSLAFDAAFNEVVSLPSDLGMMILQYPFWPLAQAGSDHVIVNGVSSVPMRYGSPIQIDVQDSTLVTPLLVTSEAGGRVQTPATVDATQDWEAVISLDDVTTETLAVAYADPDGGRMVLAGSPSPVDDQTLQRSQTGVAGLIFFQNAVDWLAQDEALITIRSKDRAPPQLAYTSDLLRDVARYGNLIGVPLLFVLIGVMRLARRRGVQSRVFEDGGALV